MAQSGQPLVTCYLDARCVILTMPHLINSLVQNLSIAAMRVERLKSTLLVFYSRQVETPY